MTPKGPKMESNTEFSTLKVRTDIHLARRLYHMIGVCIIAALYVALPRDKMLYLFCFFTAICVGADIARQKIPALHKFLLDTMGPFLRKNEISGLTGMSYMTLGITAIAIVFPPEVVILSLLMLGFGDPISSIFGIMYGKDKIVGNKTLQGTLAGFIVCTVVSGVYFAFSGTQFDRLILVSLISGLIGAVSELVPVSDLDDNFTFPIISSCLLWIFFRFISGL